MILNLCQLLCVHRGDIAVNHWHPYGPRFLRLDVVVIACWVLYSIDFLVN